METAELISYRDEFYPAGFRKVMAIMLVTAVTVLPDVFTWTSSPVERPVASRMPSGRFRPRGGFMREPEAPRTNVLGLLMTVMKRTMVVVFTTLGLIMYYPFSGFKRFAIICGPIIALIVPTCLTLYLRGRTEVFRAEIIVVALVAMLPGVGLYIFLTWQKAKRVGMVW